MSFAETQLKRARGRFHSEPQGAQVAVAGKGVEEKGADGLLGSRVHVRGQHGQHGRADARHGC